MQSDLLHKSDLQLHDLHSGVISFVQKQYLKTKSQTSTLILSKNLLDFRGNTFSPKCS